VTQEEADKLARVISTADGGCYACVTDLCRRMTAAGLGFSFQIFAGTITINAEWTDDPEFAEIYPNVIAKPIKQEAMK